MVCVFKDGFLRIRISEKTALRFLNEVFDGQATALILGNHDWIMTPEQKCPFTQSSSSTYNTQTQPSPYLHFDAWPRPGFRPRAKWCRCVVGIVSVLELVVELLVLQVSYGLSAVGNLAQAVVVGRNLLQGFVTFLGRELAPGAEGGHFVHSCGLGGVVEAFPKSLEVFRVGFSVTLGGLDEREVFGIIFLTSGR